MPQTQTKELHKSKIGGQALIEGIMMRGVHKSAMAVRTPEKAIKVEVWDNTDKSPQLFLAVRKVPFLRGIFNMIESLMIGYGCIMKSAEYSGMEEEDGEELSKFDQWLNDRLGENAYKAVSVIGGILGALLAVVLFMFLPAAAVWGLEHLVKLGAAKSLIEGLIKIVIFIVYLALVSKIPDMYRMFQYHGAEHKTIACFEAGEDLTVDNISRHSRFHPRCGTSFMFLVLLISILVSSFITWSNPLFRTVLKLLLLPVVVGISYELIRIAGRHDNLFTKIISWPGLKLQHLTTNEPDGSQIEVAIESVKPVLPETLEEDKW